MSNCSKEKLSKVITKLRTYFTQVSPILWQQDYQNLLSKYDDDVLQAIVKILLERFTITHPLCLAEIRDVGSEVLRNKKPAIDNITTIYDFDNPQYFDSYKNLLVTFSEVLDKKINIVKGQVIYTMPNDHHKLICDILNKIPVKYKTASEYYTTVNAWLKKQIQK